MQNPQLFLIFILGCALVCLVHAQEDEVEIIENTETTEATEATEATEGNEATEATETEGTTKTPKVGTTQTPIELLTEEKCGKRRKGCCEQLHLGNEEALTKCFTLHQTKIPGKDEKDPSKLFKFMSCFIECLYKQKKFLGKGDNINMKMVKLDAQKTFEKRPKERDYQIKLFEFCRKDALNLYNLIKFNPAGRLLLKDNCKPYYVFVFLCEVEYHKKRECPYFRWEGKRKTPSEESCREAKEKCYEIDGIELD